MNRYFRFLLVTLFAANWVIGARVAMVRAASLPGSRCNAVMRNVSADSAVRRYSGIAWVLAASNAAPDESGTAHGGEAAKEASKKDSAKGESEHEGYFKIINFLLLLAALVYLLRKPLRSFLADRSEDIRDALEEGSQALERSQAQLRAIQEKLKHLEEEITGFKAAAVSEMEAERQRLHQAADDEAERILDTARSQIENSARAARLELKGYAAQQALEVAETILRQRLDETGQQQLVYRFVQEVKNGSTSRS